MKNQTIYSVACDLLNGVENVYTKKYKTIHNCGNCSLGFEDSDRTDGKIRCGMSNDDETPEYNNPGYWCLLHSERTLLVKN